MRRELLLVTNEVDEMCCVRFFISVSHLVNNSVLLVKTKTQTEETSLFLRKYLNCLDQDDPKLTEALKEHYIRQRNNEQ